MDIIHTSNCDYISWNALVKKFKKQKLSFLCINVRSFIGKFLELHSYLSNLHEKFTFIVVTETWLTKETDLVLEISGYRSQSLYRPDRLGGGIKVFYLDYISVTILEQFTGCLNSCESLFLKAYIPGYGNLHVGCIYRPPSLPVSNFLEFMVEALEFLSDKRCVVLGDFNLDVLRAGHVTYINDYLELFMSYGFFNEIDQSTYVCPINNQNSSCLDHIWHNLKLKACSYIIKPNISDHYAVSTIFDIKIDNEPRLVKFRDFSDVNINNFNQSISLEFQNFNCPSRNVNEFSDALMEFLKIMNDKYFPVKSKLYTEKRLNSPWITDEVSRCIRKKHEWFKLLKKNLITYASFKEYSCALKHLLRVAERVYHVNRFKMIGKNTRKNWKILNNLLNKNNSSLSKKFLIGNVEVSDPKIVSEAFREHFTALPIEVQNRVGTPVNDFSNLIPINNQTMGFFYSTCYEIERTIDSLKKDGGLEDLSRRFLKLTRDHLSPLLSNLFNMCIDSGTYPENLKTAKITPIFKKGPRTDIKNHRPISIISNVSKIFEKLINTRLSSFLE